jgi:hypothetical protein
MIQRGYAARGSAGFQRISHGHGLSQNASSALAACVLLTMTKDAITDISASGISGNNAGRPSPSLLRHAGDATWGMSASMGVPIGSLSVSSDVLLLAMIGIGVSPGVVVSGALAARG